MAYVGFSAGRDGGLIASFRNDGWKDVVAPGLRWSGSGPSGTGSGEIRTLLSKYLPRGATYKSRRNTGSDTVMFVVLDPAPRAVREQEAAMSEFLGRGAGQRLQAAAGHMIVGLQRIGYCAPIKGIEEEPLEAPAAPLAEEEA